VLLFVALQKIVYTAIACATQAIGSRQVQMGIFIVFGIM